jgi:hypothetical protein
MKYLDAAITVLEESPAPLSTLELMDKIVRRRLVPLTGSTPVQTLSAALYRNLGKHPRLRREAVQGPVRARSGTVRWYLVDE